MSQLPHTDATVHQLREGKRAEAIREHNQRVSAELERAQRGETINLSDLMAAHDEIEVDGARERKMED